MTAIAFEFPSQAEKHPDVRVVLVPENHWGDTKYRMVAEAYLSGCKKCQNTVSRCTCAAPEVTEKLLWDWQTGRFTPMYLKHFLPASVQSSSLYAHATVPKSSAPYIPGLVTEQNIKKLLPAGMEREEEPTKPAQSRFQLLNIDPDLLGYWLCDGGLGCVKVYLSAPPHEEADLLKFFQEMNQPFPTDFAFIDEGSRGGTTKRGGASARLTFPYNPGREHIFKQLMPFEVDRLKGTANNLRFALTMMFEHKALVEFSYKKKETA